MKKIKQKYEFFLLFMYIVSFQNIVILFDVLKKKLNCIDIIFLKNLKKKKGILINV